MLYVPQYSFFVFLSFGDGNHWRGGVISVVWLEIVKNTSADFKIYCIYVDSGRVLTGFRSSSYDFLLFFALFLRWCVSVDRKSPECDL